MEKIVINRALLEQALGALQFIPASGSMLGALAEEKRVQASAALEAVLEPPEVYIPKEFNNWWAAWEHAKDNPYLLDSPKYWAWEGWKARSALAQEEQKEQDARAEQIMSEIWAQPDQTYEYIAAKLVENMQKSMKNRARVSVEAVRSALEQEEQESPRREWQGLQEQRDELLAALKRIKETGVFVGAIAQEMMDAAIAKVEGKK